MEHPERTRSWWPGPRLVSVLVGGGSAVLVLYPIVYLIQASLSVGDPQARPPEAYRLANYTGLGRYAHIFGNTLLVAVVATVLAIVLGFGMAWILSRTNVPGRDTQRVHTTVELEDGQTFVIGGLIQHDVTGTTTRVPILGDLPFVGAAFSTKFFTEDESELLVVVTPHLVDAMSCEQAPKILPGQETRSPDDFELFLEGILEAPRGPREVCPGGQYTPAFKNDPTAGLFPCGGGKGGCGAGGCGATGCGSPNGGCGAAVAPLGGGMNNPASLPEVPPARHDYTGDALGSSLPGAQ